MKLFINKKNIPFLSSVFFSCSLISLFFLTSCAKKVSENKYAKIAVFDQVSIQNKDEANQLINVISKKCNFSNEHTIYTNTNLATILADSESLSLTLLKKEFDNADFRENVYWEYLNFECNGILNGEISNFSFVGGKEKITSNSFETNIFKITIESSALEISVEIGVNQPILYSFHPNSATAWYSPSLFYKDVVVK